MFNSPDLLFRISKASQYSDDKQSLSLSHRICGPKRKEIEG